MYSVLLFWSRFKLHSSSTNLDPGKEILPASRMSLLQDRISISQVGSYLLLIKLPFFFLWQMRLEGERGLTITYDPPGPGSFAPSPNQFPVNTQEICYINVSWRMKRKKYIVLTVPIYFAIVGFTGRRKIAVPNGRDAIQPNQQFAYYSGRPRRRDDWRKPSVWYATLLATSGIIRQEGSNAGIQRTSPIHRHQPRRIYTVSW